MVTMTMTTMAMMTMTMMAMMAMTMMAMIKDDDDGRRAMDDGR
jgi:hypothetical protein